MNGRGNGLCFELSPSSVTITHLFLQCIGGQRANNKSRKTSLASECDWNAFTIDHAVFGTNAPKNPPENDNWVALILKREQVWLDPMDVDVSCTCSWTAMWMLLKVVECHVRSGLAITTCRNFNFFVSLLHLENFCHSNLSFTSLVNQLFEQWRFLC